MLPSMLSAVATQLLADIRPTDLRAAVRRQSARYRDPTWTGSPIETSLDAYAYVAYRMPAIYAVGYTVLSELRRIRPQWQPATVLDVGAGPGTATWAALALWPSLRECTLLEPDPHMRTIGRRFDSAVEHSASRRWLDDDLHTARLPGADLVIASYVLGEAGSKVAVAERLWTVTHDTFVLIEPGTPTGFDLIRDVRSMVLDAGGCIVCPCTRGRDCPMPRNDWCHFSQRLPRTSLHRFVKDASLAYEDEPYSYVAATRAHIAVGGHRIIRTPRTRPGLVSLTTCSKAGITQLTVSRRDRDRYRNARRSRWGEHFPEHGTVTPRRRRTC